MRTREESLNSFCRAVDGLSESKYLFANTGIYEVITVINSSKLLSDLFKYFTEDFDFYDVLTKCLVENDGVKSFVLPARNTDVIAFVYLLLREINYNKFQLSDLLDYMNAGKNYEAGYKNFCKAVLLPFRSYTYQIGMQLINSVQFPGEGETTDDETDVDTNVKPNIVNPVINTNVVTTDEDTTITTTATTTTVTTEETTTSTTSGVNQTNVINNVNNGGGNVTTGEETTTVTTSNAVNNTQKITFQRNIYRLLELDKLAITQSHTSREDKEELIYVLEIFTKKLNEGDKEKISLAYLAYYYALRPYKKIKTNLKDITDILLSMGVLG